MAETTIQWTDHSLNPIRARRFLQAEPEPQYAMGHHCRKISPGCANCYASKMQSRFRMPEYLGEGAGLNGVEPFLDESKLAEVLRRKKPTKYFWCDMTDLFGEWVLNEWIDRCFATMALTPQHTHQVLTKRPERMLEYVTTRGYHAYNDVRLETEQWPARNIWFGVSVEDQTRADERIPLLLQTPAAVRFLSIEPLLGPISLEQYLWAAGGSTAGPWQYPSGRVERASGIGGQTISSKPAREIRWTIIGGESGPHARPCHLEWVRDLVRQCQAAGTAVFVKQLGRSAWSTVKADHRGRIDKGAHMGSAPVAPEPWRLWLDDSHGGDPAEWPEDLRVRQFPEVSP